MINLGIINYTKETEKFLEYFKDIPNINFQWICDKNYKKCLEIKNKYNIKNSTIYTIDVEDVDFIYISKTRLCKSCQTLDFICRKYNIILDKSMFAMYDDKTISYLSNEFNIIIHKNLNLKKTKQLILSYK